MLNFSQREEYAILFITKLAENFGKQPVSLTIIAKATDMKLPFLRQVAIDLKHAGLLLSLEGKHGGYQLAKAPNAITMADVLEAVEHKKLLNCCNPRDFSSCNNHCKNDLLWRKLSKHFVKNLYHITFDRVIEDGYTVIASKTKQSLKPKGIATSLRSSQ